MERRSEFFKTRGGGQFFKMLGEDEAKIISLYDFNPLIERRRLSAQIMEQLKCVPCQAAEFEQAEQEVLRLLELPFYLPVA